MKKQEIKKLRELSGKRGELIPKTLSIYISLQKTEVLVREGISEVIGGFPDNSIPLNEAVNDARKTLSRLKRPAVIPHYEAYEKLAQKQAANTEEIKRVEAELKQMIEEIRLDRQQELMKAYNSALEVSQKALLPFCEDEDDAAEMARLLRRNQQIHIRWSSLITCGDLSGDAENLARELEREVPVFTVKA